MKKILALLFIIGMTSCGSNNEISDTNSAFAEKDYYEEYNLILNNLDQEYPGRGLDFFDEDRKDRPMAYGLIISSEANRYQYTNDLNALDMVRVCGQYLIEHSDINGDGIHGYGLADDWDAFQDGSVNPENQEYTITTAIAIKGLLDWYDVEIDLEKKEEIKKIVLRSLIPFLDTGYDSPLGIPVYSFSSYDLNYDIFNPAVFLAGQMRRFSVIIDDSTLASVLEERSTKIIEILFDYSLTDVNGNLYWIYGVQRDIPNDLVHACYIVEGVRDYIAYGGTLELDWNVLFNHLYLFKPEEQWFEFVVAEMQTEERNSRLWALGMLMYSLSKEGDFAEIKESLAIQLRDNYYLGNGEFRFKTNNDRLMVRHHAHLLLGLSYYIYN